MPVGDFQGQTAVVTGASSGIGRAIAVGLAQQGATVCLVGRDASSLEAIARNYPALASGVVCYKADLEDDKDLLELKARLRWNLGHVDVLVHSAGAICLGRIESARIEDLDQQYRINVRAPYVLTQALLPMLKLRKGQIVFINSSVSLRNAEANLGQYSATKHALKAIADSLRSEVNAEGLRVLSVYPGRTASRMQEAVRGLEGKEYSPERLMQPEDVAAVVLHALCLPRTVEVTDISLRPLAKC